MTKKVTAVTSSYTVATLDILPTDSTSSITTAANSSIDSNNTSKTNNSNANSQRVSFRGFHRSCTAPEEESAYSISSAPSAISPSSTCFQRKMSTAVATAPDAQHELLEGRPRLVYSNKGNKVMGHLFGAKSSKNQKHQQHPPAVKRSTTVPMETERLPDWLINPVPLNLQFWSDPPATNFKVRGSNYLKDGLKQSSLDSHFQLLTVDLLKVNTPLPYAVCAHPNERIQQALQREALTGIPELPQFIFAINYIIPGAAASGQDSSDSSDTSHNNDNVGYSFHWVAYFGTNDVEALQDQSTPMGRLANRFFFGNMDGPGNAFRNNAFKLVPRIVAGNFIVRKAVGSKPTLLGRKLKQQYFRDNSNSPSGPRYFELVVDIASDAIADRMVRLALGSAKALVVDMMFLLEGNTADTLPEQILCGARIEHLDFKQKAPELFRWTSVTQAQAPPESAPTSSGSVSSDRQ